MYLYCKLIWHKKFLVKDHFWNYHAVHFNTLSSKFLWIDSCIFSFFFFQVCFVPWVSQEKVGWPSITLVILDSRESGHKDYAAFPRFQPPFTEVCTVTVFTITYCLGIPIRLGMIWGRIWNTFYANTRIIRVVQIVHWKKNRGIEFFTLFSRKNTFEK